MKLQRFSIMALGVIAAAGFAAAQNQPHPWRSADVPAQGQAGATVVAPPDQAAPPDAPGQVTATPEPQTQYPQYPQSAPQPYPAQQPEPQAQYPQSAPQPYPAQQPEPQAQYPQSAPQPYPAQQTAPQPYPAPQPAPPYAAPPGPGQPSYPAQPSSQAPYGQNTAPAPPANYGPPAHMTIRPGTFVTVRIDQWLSSDRNQPGDAFAATLAAPIVVDGFVVARPGQTVGGRVTEAQKAGRVEGTSRLGLGLTDLTLADGQTVQILSQMIQRNGPTSIGRDAAAVGGTTALGAAIGAGVGWGRGAAIGAGAGAAAGVLGVLLTRGQPTVVYPETLMTFRIEQPVDFSTEQAPQAFEYVNNRDYGRRYGQAPPRITAAPAPAPYPGVYPYPYAYGYPYYPYYAYPGFGVYIGRGYYYGPRFYGGFRYYRR